MANGERRKESREQKSLALSISFSAPFDYSQALLFVQLNKQKSLTLNCEPAHYGGGGDSQLRAARYVSRAHKT